MKKKIMAISVVLLLCLSFVLAACGTIVVTDVSLNKTTISLEVGSGERLIATVTPGDATEKAVTWESDTAAVATVDEYGKVIAISVGTAKITATAIGSDKKATCTVTVTAPPIAATGVALNKKTTALIAGASETLVATVAPANAANKAVTWTSSKPDVATVDASGKVTAIAAGTAVILATTADGGKIAACGVNVTSPVTGVTLNKSTIAMFIGDNETLTATVAPSGATNKGITWWSGNSSVASVDADGKVSGLSVGTAIITAVSVDGAKSASCAVTVAFPVTINVSMNKGSLDLNIGEKETLTAAIYPSGVVTSTVWTSSDPAVATVVNGEVTAVAKGIATITATNDGKSATSIAYVADGIAISSADQFRSILNSSHQGPGKYFLTNDIDFKGATIQSIGVQDGAQGFSGIFDGCGYALKNYTSENGEWNSALFAGLNGGTIKNLSLINAKMRALSNGASLLVGSVYSGTVENVYIEGEIPNAGNTAKNDYASGGTVFGRAGDNSPLASEPNSKIIVKNVVTKVTASGAGNTQIYPVCGRLLSWPVDRLEFSNIFIVTDGLAEANRTANFRIAPANAVINAVNAGVTKFLMSGIGSVSFSTLDSSVWQLNAGALPTLKNEAKIAISTTAGLLAINNNLSGSYYLANDIDFKGATIKSLAYKAGGGLEKVPFSGILDGCGYAIKNYVMEKSVKADKTDDDWGVALFTELTGTVRNLSLVNFEHKGWGQVGSIAGGCAGTIENCYIQGYVNSSNTGWESWPDGIGGGIVGCMVSPCAIKNNVTNVKTSGAVLIFAGPSYGDPINAASIVLKNNFALGDNITAGSKYAANNGDFFVDAGNANRADIAAGNYCFDSTTAGANGLLLANMDFSSLYSRIWTFRTGKLPVLKNYFELTPAIDFPIGETLYSTYTGNPSVITGYTNHIATNTGGGAAAYVNAQVATRTYTDFVEVTRPIDLGAGFSLTNGTGYKGFNYSLEAGGIAVAYSFYLRSDLDIANAAGVFEISLRGNNTNDNGQRIVLSLKDGKFGLAQNKNGAVQDFTANASAIYKKGEWQRYDVVFEKTTGTEARILVHVNGVKVAFAQAAAEAVPNCSIVDGTLVVTNGIDANCRSIFWRNLDAAGKLDVGSIVPPPELPDEPDEPDEPVEPEIEPNAPAAVNYPASFYTAANWLAFGGTTAASNVTKSGDVLSFTNANGTTGAYIANGNHGMLSFCDTNANFASQLGGGQVKTDYVYTTMLNAEGNGDFLMTFFGTSTYTDSNGAAALAATINSTKHNTSYLKLSHADGKLALSRYVSNADVEHAQPVAIQTDANTGYLAGQWNRIDVVLSRDTDGTLSGTPSAKDVRGAEITVKIYVNGFKVNFDEGPAFAGGQIALYGNSPVWMVDGNLVFGSGRFDTQAGTAYSNLGNRIALIAPQGKTVQIKAFA